jgi:hypothetical protein
MDGRGQGRRAVALRRDAHFANSNGAPLRLCYDGVNKRATVAKVAHASAAEVRAQPVNIAARLDGFCDKNLLAWNVFKPRRVTRVHGQSKPRSKARVWNVLQTRPNTALVGAVASGLSDIRVGVRAIRAEWARIERVFDAEVGAQEDRRRSWRKEAPGIRHRVAA